MECRSFEPVYTSEARALIIGSMPGTVSLHAQQYYAHPRNAFWPILFDYFGEERSSDYEVRKALIRDHALALWDAAQVCSREGSLDTAIRNPEINDFAFLFEACPGIRTILCNGKTAFRLFSSARVSQGREIIAMPSTSPAYTMPFEEKRQLWFDGLMHALRAD